jgi:hypothetical protein
MNSIDYFAIENLKKGESCTYEVQGRCGAPSFALKESSNVTDDIISVHFVEWNLNDYNFFKDVEVTEEYNPLKPMQNNVTTRYEQTFRLTMPTRNV